MLITPKAPRRQRGRWFERRSALIFPTSTFAALSHARLLLFQSHCSPPAGHRAKRVLRCKLGLTHVRPAQHEHRQPPSRRGLWRRVLRRGCRDPPGRSYPCGFQGRCDGSRTRYPVINSDLLYQNELRMVDWRGVEPRKAPNEPKPGTSNTVLSVRATLIRARQTGMVSHKPVIARKTRCFDAQLNRFKPTRIRDY